MTDGVINQAAAAPETVEPQKLASDKARENFARLEASKQVERDARIRAEMEREMLQKQINEMKLAQSSKEEPDPLDGVDDYIDKAFSLSVKKIELLSRRKRKRSQIGLMRLAEKMKINGTFYQN
jgi:hypothetical protein